MFLYVLFIIGIALSRLYEVRLSKKHLQMAQSQENVHSIPEIIYPLMVAFHSCWLLSCLVEVYWLNRPFFSALGIPMLFLWLLAFSGRLWMLWTMKASWNVRIVYNPQQDIVTSGPYRYLRHPNYVIVAIEIFCIPMIHTAYLTALIGTGLNALLIWQRLKTEEAYLASLPGYSQKMGHLPRFIPHQLTKLLQRWGSSQKN